MLTFAVHASIFTYHSSIVAYLQCHPLLWSPKCTKLQLEDLKGGSGVQENSSFPLELLMQLISFIIAFCFFKQEVFEVFFISIPPV